MIVLRRAFFALLAVLVSSSAFAQTTRAITWDPSPEESTRVLEYHVFRDAVYAGAITVPNRTFAFTIAPGEVTTFVVRSYGWLANPDGTLTTEAGVGDPSVPFTWQEPAAPPPDPEPEPEPEPEPPPSDTVAPSVTLRYTQEGRSHNYTLIAEATDNVGVAHIVIYSGSGAPIGACSNTGTCSLDRSLKQRGTYVYYAVAWDAANNQGFSAEVTIRR